ncbi:MAG: GreA/GreB family elongation factor [Chitinophagaceae bacterium]|nr:GreA/GreB family elongation factor [Chitinophagaceae bacterium]
MQQIKDPLILRKDDYQVLVSFLKDGRYARRIDARNITDLESELRKATLVNKDEFPDDVVRLNSKIKIKESGKENVMELILVTPDKADIKERKISVLAPIGTAVIGFKKGKTIIWEVPGGEKRFTIMEVTN